MNNVEIKNVDFSFKDYAVFKNLSLEVSEGSIIGIIGPNGIGKSVLFKLIAGLHLPDKGSITVNGKDLLRRDFPDDFGASIE
ncbi:ATP-binding cassette domain-containing protein [Apilactobacillus kunkeei]|uniref:ATP-binding cassette domain-containing protein n=1 Tax=Apilactobacillus kunkeei TaxID=148814 RepID=UPI0040334232